MSKRSSTQGRLKEKLEELVEPLFYTSEKYSTNFVLNSLVEQSSHDLNLLQQIHYQRSNSGSQAVTTFLIAEELGRRALKPARGKLLDERYSSVLCYLDNRMEVRLLPYNDSVLMGVPHVSHSSHRRDPSEAKEAHAEQQVETGSPKPLRVKYPMTFTAIPHEIGHVIYRFGLFPLIKGKLHVYRILKNRLLAKPYELRPQDWRFNWLEEIFADAYGCLVAGPITVLGFQLMLADGPPQHLRGHLGDHPTPVLRPLVQSQILRKARTQYGNPIFPEAPALLDARWQNWVAANWPHWVANQWLGYTDQTDIIRDALFDVVGVSMTGQEILDALEPLIEVVLLTLERIRPEHKTSSWTPNWDAANDTERLAGLYGQFVKFASEVAQDALETQQDLKSERDFAPRLNQTLDQLLSQFTEENATGWRVRSGGIDELIETILFESWSEEGGKTQHAP